MAHILKRLTRALPPSARVLGARKDEALGAVQALGLRRMSQVAARVLGERKPDVLELTDWQRRTLEHLIRRMCHDPDGELPDPIESGAVEATLDFATHMPEVTYQQLLDLLAVFEAGVRWLGPDRQAGRFTALTPTQQDAYMRAWEQSALEPQRAAFQGLKSACMVGYWTREQTWPHIGYGLDTELLEEEND